MSKLVVNLISFNNPVFQSYLFWSAILVLKILLMSIFTGFQKLKHKVINEQDIQFAGVYKSMHNSYNDSQARNTHGHKFENLNVEICERAHRNDLENILPFFVIGYLYLMINPETHLAINLYRAVGLSRILHSILYVLFTVPKSIRNLTFLVCYGSTVYMAIKVIQFTM